MSYGPGRWAMKGRNAKQSSCGGGEFNKVSPCAVHRRGRGGKIAPLAEHGCKYKKHVGVARVLQPVVCCSAFSVVKMLWITGGKNVVQMRNLYLTKTLNATKILMIYFVVDIDQHRYLRGVTVKSIKCKKQQLYIPSKTFLFDLEIANGRARRSHCGN